MLQYMNKLVYNYCKCFLLLGQHNEHELSALTHKQDQSFNALCIQFELKFTHIFNMFYVNQWAYKLNDVSDMGAVVWLS